MASHGVTPPVKMDNAGRASVVLLHGLGRTSRSMTLLERALAGAGCRTLNLDYASRRKPLEQLAEEVGPAIVAFGAGGDGPLHVVAHSMGGLLARLCLARRRPPRLGRVVMLGPPNDGSPLADLLERNPAFRVIFGPAGRQLTSRHAAVLRSLCGAVDYAVGVIAGTRSVTPFSRFLLREPNDGKVTVRSTRLDGIADHIALPVTHPFMMRDPAVIAATLHFLREGRFR